MHVRSREAGGGVDPDWRALECVRANGLSRWIQLVRLAPGEASANLLEKMSASTVLRLSCRNVEEVNVVTCVVEAFVSPSAEVLYWSVCQL